MEDAFSHWLELLVPWGLLHGVRIIIIAAAAFTLHKISNRFIEKMVRIAVVSDRFTSMEAERKREDTLIRIIRWTTVILIWVVAGIMILDEFGAPIGPILASAGIVGLAFGFGGQYLVRDIISGFFIILENQYRIGDVVDLGGTGGLVEDISLRITTLRDMDGTVHHVPHGDIKRVANLSKNFSRVNLNIGIGYNSSLEHVIGVINKIGKDLSEDPEWKEHILEPPKFLRVEKLGDSAIIIKIVGQTRALSQWSVTGELRKRILITFRKEGIEIPFPQMVIHTESK
jgi:moderate conductance mechanosensitive channel